jgi:hypothetical protein
MCRVVSHVWAAIVRPDDFVGGLCTCFECLHNP